MADAALAPTFTIWTPLTLLATLLIIQPVKGGVIGLQWALKMHGFGGHGDEHDQYEILVGVTKTEDFP